MSTSVSVAQSIDTFVQNSSSILEPFSQTKAENNFITVFLLGISTLVTLVCFFVILYNDSGSGGFKNLYKKLNK